MNGVNRQFLLAGHPDGELDEELFELVEGSIPDPDSGEIIVKTLYLSIRPFIREQMAASNPMTSTWNVGDPIKGGVIGEVVASEDPELPVGTIVKAELSWAEYNVATADTVELVDTGSAPITTSVGVLGRPGKTAYFGMLDVGRPRPGDTVVVSSAAGATGSVAGQLAKLAGCRVVGIAGADEKIDFITEECGMDAGINYKTTDDLAAAVGEVCPDGVDLYYDNVGGETTDAVISQLATGATIVLCGQISVYNQEKPVGPNHFLQFIYDRVRVEGFGRSQFSHRFDEAHEHLLKWIESGQLVYRETVTEGFEQTPEAFIGLFEGTNIGRQLVKVAEPSS